MFLKTADLTTFVIVYISNTIYCELNSSIVGDMESLQHVLDLIKSCLLPELKQDLDSLPIEKEHFENYNECLQLKLPILYDWIQQQQIYCPLDTYDVDNNLWHEVKHNN